MDRPEFLLLVATLASVLPPSTVVGQDEQLPTNEVELNGDGTAGALAVNLVAGSGNQQANVGLIASGGIGLADGAVVQALSIGTIGGSASAEVRIADGAFAGSTGWLATNIGAGLGNQQANVATIGIGFTGEVATAAMLSQSRASTMEGDRGETPNGPEPYRTQIGDGAFANSSGVVQVNLAAGDGNTSANIFALSIPGQ